MAIKPVPPLTDVPPFPALADYAAGTYNSKAFNFGTHMADKFSGELAAVAENVRGNAIVAEQSALAVDQVAAVVAADRRQTKEDREATAADRVQTSADRAAAEDAARQIGTAAAFSDANAVVKGATDPTKLLRFLVSGLAPGVERMVSAPRQDGQLMTREDLASFFYNRIESIDVSGNFVAKVSGPHRITLIGPAGSGALAAVNDSNGGFDSAAAASGGATGGIAIKQLNLQAGDSLAVVMGAPGAARSYAGAGSVNIAGIAGGQSRVTGPGIALISNGGTGGRATVTTNNTTAIALGAVGGTASGGDINITGSDSGTATASSTTVSNVKTAAAAATGGAGVPYYGQRFSSGNATVAGGAAATGGSSPSGRSGSVNVTTATVGASGGAGTGNSPDVVGGSGARGPGVPTFSIAGFSLTGNGGLGAADPSINADGAGNGGAGGAYAFRPSSGVQVSGTSGSSGLFAGSGAAAVGRNPTTANVVNVGLPGRGGASGAVAVVTSNTSVTLLVPAAGSSVCIIEYYQEQTT